MVVPVSTLATESTPVVTDISPGGAVGMEMDKIYDGSADKCQLTYAVML